MFGQRLRELRNQKKYTQEYVANLIGVTRAAYSAYESDKRQPNFEILSKLANLYGVTTDYLLGRNQTPAWATKKDTLELRNFIDENSAGGMTFDGEDLTKEENEKVEIAMTQIFWDKLKKIKEREAKDHGENKWTK